MKKIMNIVWLLLLFAGNTLAQKTVYIPQEWRNRTDTLIYKESDPDNKYTWPKSHAVQPDDINSSSDKKHARQKPNEPPQND